MEKLKVLFTVAVVLAWLHLLAFSALIVLTFVGLIYSIYYILENRIQIQNIIIVMMVAFAGLTVFGIFDYAANEFLKGLKHRDHSRMLMFKICTIFLLACGFGVFCCGLYRWLYCRHDLTDRITLICLIGGTIGLIIECIIFIIVQVISSKFRLEAQRQSEEKYTKRKVNAVCSQMSHIFQPIEMDNVIQEKTFEKVLVEKSRIFFEELSLTDMEMLPPPPEDF